MYHTCQTNESQGDWDGWYYFFIGLTLIGVYIFIMFVGTMLYESYQAYIKKRGPKDNRSPEDIEMEDVSPENAI